MRVSNNANHDALISQIHSLSRRQADLHTQIATGQRVTRPSDDPLAMSRAMDAQSDQRRLHQFSSNLGRAQEISEVTFKSTDQMKDILVRARELATLSDELDGAEGLDAYAIEVNALIEQALQVSNGKFRGEYLFASTKTATQPYNAARDASGDITAVDYFGVAAGPAAGEPAQGVQFNVSEDTRLSPYAEREQNELFRDIMNNLVGLRDALRAGDVPAIRTLEQAPGGLAEVEDSLITAMSSIGATQTRLEGVEAQNTLRSTELEERVSREVDADLAETIVRLNQTQTAYQAALQSGSRILRQSILDYI